VLTRSLGRPKNRWEDDVKSYITRMKITNWKDCIITITHLQEHKTTVTIASGNHYTVLLSAAIVEEVELI
jgi:hypothetical protein